MNLNIPLLPVQMYTVPLSQQKHLPVSESRNSQRRIYNTKSIKHNVRRICTLSIILSIGYIVNIISVLKSTYPTETWAFIYVSSFICLFISCSLMIFITLYDFHTKRGQKRRFSYFNRNKCQNSKIFVTEIICLFCIAIGVFGHITSLVIGINSNKQIYLELESLYSLLPLYMIFLRYFFFKSIKSKKIKKLAIFSCILFITPFCRLLLILIAWPSPLPMTLIIIYSSVCIPTSTLVLLHIIYLLIHYKTGLFLKLIIISLLAYNIIQSMSFKLDFDKYDDIYRTYCYYLLLIVLYIMYAFEIFIDPRSKVQIKSAQHYQNRTSYHYDISHYETALPRIVSNATVQPQMQRELLSEFRTEKPIIQPIIVDSVIKVFPDCIPTFKNKDLYFNEIDIDIRNKEEQKRLKDSIAVIVTFYNEEAHEILATLRSLYFNFRYIKEKTQKNLEYDNTHFNVLLVGDGWDKAHKSTKKYLTQLYTCKNIDSSFNYININNKHNTVILQTKGNKKLCINPFHNNDDRLYLKVTTVMKIDNRKKANSHEWFLGKHGFAEWCKCDYMYYTDAYSTLNKKGLYKMTKHMKQAKNANVVCCTGRARVYTVKQETKFKTHIRHNPNIILNSNNDNYRRWSDLDIFKSNNDYLGEYHVEYDYNFPADKDTMSYFKQCKQFLFRILSINSHLRQCQQFEFEALYGVIGCYLVGGFLPVIPGPCGFYRSKYLLRDRVREWYFNTIKLKNDSENIDLVLGNMKLAEDRILSLTSIINCNESVRHSLIPDCVFYFDPVKDIESLMKQRRRWINGSIATILFVLKRVSFKTWNVNFVRKFYVRALWYMQLFMFLVLFVSAPLLFIVSFEYGFVTIVQWILGDHNHINENIKIYVVLLMIWVWIVYFAFIYFAQTPGKKPDETANKCTKINYYFKSKSVKLMLVMSYTFSILTATGLIMQFAEVINTVMKPADLLQKPFDFDFFVTLMGVIFFLQSFVLPPIFSKDMKTLIILLKTGLIYLIYAPFYVIFIFIYSIANVHDLSWGTRPDKEAQDKSNNNPKRTTWKILFFLLLSNIIITIVIQAFSEHVYAKYINITIFSMLALPSLFQLFFAVLWLTMTRFIDFVRLCVPKKMNVKINTVN